MYTMYITLKSDSVKRVHHSQTSVNTNPHLTHHPDIIVPTATGGPTHTSPRDYRTHPATVPGGAFRFKFTWNKVYRERPAAVTGVPSHTSPHDYRTHPATAPGGTFRFKFTSNQEAPVIDNKWEDELPF